MVQNNQNADALHYETLIRLFSLGSQEFYNRFTAMVLTHTILLSGLVVGTGIFRDPILDRSMKLATAIVVIIGIILCIIWKLLLRQSLNAQTFYREQARGLENNLGFSIISAPGWQGLQGNFNSIRFLSYLIIGLYIFLYLIVLLLILV